MKDNNRKRTCQCCKGLGRRDLKMEDKSGKSVDGCGVIQIVPCDFPGCHNSVVNIEENYRITNG